MPLPTLDQALDQALDGAALPQYREFRAEVREFVTRRLPQDIRDRLRRGYVARKEDTVRWQRILHERGWAAPQWPKAYGGAELGIVERLILMEETALAPAPLPHVQNVAMLGPVLIRYGTPAQQQRFLPALANADLLFAQGFSEPGAGSDLAALRTTARREGNHYIVDGQKIWTSMAHWCDWLFALVRTARTARKQEGISFLLIDLRSPGLAVRPIIGLDGQRHLNEVFFDGVRVPCENLVGAEGQGWEIAKSLLGFERAAVANVGWCRQRLDDARLIARSQMEGARPLLDDPALAAELAVLDAEARALDITNWRYLTATDQAPPAFASILKLKGAELQQDVAAMVARLAGPSGIEETQIESEDSPQWHAALLPRYYYARAASIFGGASEIQKDILAKQILG